MKRILLAFLLLTVFPIFGCDCDGVDINQELVENSDLILGGTVLSIEYIKRIDSENSVETKLMKVLLLVNSSYKGQLYSEEIEVYTDGDNSCGINFQKGKYYIVFGNFCDQMGRVNRTIKGNRIFTDHCMLSQLYSKELEDKVVGLIKSLGPCQIIVTSTEEVIVELDHSWINGTNQGTIILTQGDVCEIFGSTATKEGKIIYHGKFKDKLDGGKSKSGIIISNGNVWGRKIDTYCELSNIVIGVAH